MNISNHNKTTHLMISTQLFTTKKLAWRLGLVLAILLILITNYNQQRSLIAMNKMTDLRANAWKSRFTLEQVLSLFKDIETGSRGYAITGDSKFLEPFDHGLAILPNRYAEMKAYFQKSEFNTYVPAKFNWDEIDEAVESRQELANEVIRTRQKIGSSVMQDIALFQDGKDAMDEIRLRFSQLDATAAKRITVINDAVIQLRKKSIINSWITASLGLGFLLIALIILFKERKQRILLAQQLVQSNLTLESNVLQRTAELKNARDEIAAFANTQNLAIEIERRRLSQEVHDQIGQVFTAIKMIVNTLAKNSWPAGQRTAMEQALSAGIASTRRITSELRPALLDDFGFKAAATHYAKEIAIISLLNFKVEITQDDSLNDSQALCLFRILQEAVTNIMRHAKASEVSIFAHAYHGFFTLSISDNGLGFNAKNIRKGAIGLTSMRERAAMLDGNFKVASKETGTVITVSCPIFNK